MKRIAIIGPESTGKSTLCEQLAQHYGTVWCPEYAREYLLERGTEYSYDDLLRIARGQAALEDRMQGEASRHYFIDTNMYVMKVWCEVVFGDCHKWILNEAATRSYDLYLLCNTDLPWVQDGLREYPDPLVRERLFNMYYDLLVNDGTPWAVISGVSGEERLQGAIRHINALSAQ